MSETRVLEEQIAYLQRDLAETKAENSRVLMAMEQDRKHFKVKLRKAGELIAYYREGLRAALELLCAIRVSPAPIAYWRIPLDEFRLRYASDPAKEPVVGREFGDCEPNVGEVTHG